MNSLSHNTYTRRGDVAPTPEAATALRWAGWGMAVGPLVPRGKEPLIPGGFKNFTTDPAQIRQWWSRWPNANIGMTPAADVVVLDYDKPGDHHATEHDGEQTWEQMYRGHEIPPTLRVLTGGGGLHEFYRLPHEGKIRGEAGPGVDTRLGGNGYVVAAGSTHPSGAPYSILEWHDPRALPTLPDYLHRFVYKPLVVPQPAAAPRQDWGHGDGSGLVRTVAEAPQGQRNKLLFWAACQANRDGLDLTAELTDAARTCGLGDTEISRTLESAARTAKGAA